MIEAGCKIVLTRKNIREMNNIMVGTKVIINQGTSINLIKTTIEMTRTIVSWTKHIEKFILALMSEF